MMEEIVPSGKERKCGRKETGEGEELIRRGKKKEKKKDNCDGRWR